MEFYEAFNIAHQTRDYWFTVIPIFTGISFIVASVKKLTAIIKSPGNIAQKVNLSVMILLGIGLIAFGIQQYFHEQNRFEHYAQQVNSSDVVSVEGVVNVTFEEPWDGHAGGDIIHVADKTFEIQQYSGSYFYHDSISHGGVLKQNNYVRIYYIPTTEYYRPLFGDGQIVRIECRK